MDKFIRAGKGVKVNTETGEILEGGGETSDAPMGLCPQHKVPFVKRQGQSGAWWACPKKVGDAWCKEKPQAQASPTAQGDTPPPNLGDTPTIGETPLPSVEGGTINDWTGFWDGLRSLGIKQPEAKQVLGMEPVAWMKANPGKSHNDMLAEIRAVAGK